ncbi:ABC transporter ATP-binding protein [Nocardiopsis terrae]|uniref:Peptide/nickel transport system ATP-binding protein n=1 Tax=Nocardiopsis terrae TaxID=372655 RepID=A0ABR9HCR3_9ACTN|nr:ATP-binding cassette domain-containing protein [Nocardiopsis terrae]MBE1456811.1 peptide/nickel transport system ATP-binding protein [Nocardiopsis terrae]GHC74999.1 ABC transporter ATP-binding protein [Nocardiopsis terrae]
MTDPNSPRDPNPAHGSEPAHDPETAAGGHGDTGGTDPKPLLDVRDLRVSFPGKGWRAPRTEVLRGVSLDIRPGETLGLVGESGSGKSTIGRAVLGLVPASGGSISFDGERVDGASRRRRRELSRHIQVVFQDPYTSLNPSLLVGDTLAEPLLAHGVPAAEARTRVADLLDRVALPRDAVHRLPREFSGGQRQRVAIARALAIAPRLIVCDEPVSALDLTTQRTVMDLLLDIQERTGTAYLFVSHDLSVVRALSHRVAVIHQGQIVEYGGADRVTTDPEHPYTQRLLLSAPVADPGRQSERRAEYERRFHARAH